MIVVVDARVLVAELLRRRGRELFAHPDLQCLVAEEQWEEARHELQKRVAAIVGQGRLSDALLDSPDPASTSLFVRPARFNMPHRSRCCFTGSGGTAKRCGCP